MIIVRNFRKFLICSGLLLLIAGVARATEREPLGAITYRLAMSQPASHLFEVTIEIEFQPDVADYVRAREWHPSQRLEQNPAGALRVTLDVCLDRALQSWILSFGPFARVVAPEKLAKDIADQFEEARAQYADR